MEFLTVGNSKIKIMLTSDEAAQRGLYSDKMNYDDPTVRRNFRKILDEAREKAGFDIGKEKVLIQFYPSRDGGMELFVTKLGIISKEAANMISRSEHVAVISAKRVYYIFSTLEDLLGALRCIPTGEVEDSSIHRLEDGNYCLSFCEREQKCVLSKLSRIFEFGKRINDLTAVALVEHAYLLRSGDAAEIFSRL